MTNIPFREYKYTARRHYDKINPDSVKNNITLAPQRSNALKAMKQERVFEKYYINIPIKFQSDMNKNCYYNELIDFYIEKPDSWVFFPTSWAMNIRKKTAFSNEEIRKIVEQANHPFVYMQKPSNDTEIAYPTVQATCRHFPTPDALTMETVLSKQLTVFEQQFSDYQIHDYSSKHSLSDHPANYFKVAFSIKNEAGTVFKCLSQSWVIFWNNIAYTVGLSGSAENELDYLSDHDFILSSILIGKDIYSG